GLFLFSLIGADTPLWQTCLIMPVVGLGLGGNMQPIILATQNAVSPREIGVATSSVTFFRQMGGTLGTAVFLSVLLTNLPGKIAGAFSKVQGTPDFRAALAANPEQAATLQGATSGNADLNDTSFISRLDPVIAHPFKVGFSDSMTIVFLLGAAIMIVGLIVVLFLPEVALSERSAAQARAAEDATAGQSGEAAVADVHGDGQATGAVPAGLGAAEPEARSPEARSEDRAAATGARSEDGAAATGVGTEDGVRIDPDADGRGRHNAEGRPDELRVPVDGQAGGGKHEADGYTLDGEPARGRPSAG
ncbi:MAG TPA: hypothetical protein VI357_03210, partial [Mycobacteriales bacterium]